MRIPTAIEVNAQHLMTVANAANRQQDAEAYYLLQAYADLLAERLREKAASAGARVWIVQWTAELMPRDIASPGETIKYLVPGKPWPRAQQGATVEIDGVAHKVVVNAATKKSGHECQFGIYIVKPISVV